MPAQFGFLESVVLPRSALQKERLYHHDILPIVDELLSVSVGGLDESGLRSALQDARKARNAIDALISKIGVEVDRLAASGLAIPADELFRADNQVRASTAKRDITRAKTTGSITGLERAVSTGKISSDHVDILGQRYNKLSPNEQSQLNTGRLLEQATKLAPKPFDRAVKRAVDQLRQDDGLTESQQKRNASEFTHWFDHRTGMGKFHGQLDPERYEALTTAIDQHTASLAAADDQPSTKDPHLAVQALVELVCSSGQRTQHLPHVTVVVDERTLTTGPHNTSRCETGNGHHLPPQTIDRLACDSVLQRVTLDDRGVPINVGRKYRTATSSQWTALRAVYSTCAWKDCDRPLSWCQLHHITEWRNGGATDLDNLVPLCSTHHHRVHEGQWSTKLAPDRTLEIFKPCGDHYANSPPDRTPQPNNNTEHNQRLATPVNMETARRRLEHSASYMSDGSSKDRSAGEAS